MVRTRSGSVEGYAPNASVRSGGGYGYGYGEEGGGGRFGADQRSQSMTSGFGHPVRPVISPGWSGGEDVPEEEEMVDEQGGYGHGVSRGYSNEDVFGHGDPWSGGDEQSPVKAGRR